MVVDPHLRVGDIHQMMGVHRRMNAGNLVCQPVDHCRQFLGFDVGVLNVQSASRIEKIILSIDNDEVHSFHSSTSNGNW